MPKNSPVVLIVGHGSSSGKGALVDYSVPASDGIYAHATYNIFKWDQRQRNWNLLY
jgi:hypothetical protein